MSNNGTTRVHYYERQFLRTEDFVDEQAYHLALHRRHNIAGHIWGIVAGLEVEKDKDQNLAVGPGLAIDGYGRELILPVSQPLSPKAFDEKASEVLDVWLVYARQDSDQAPPGYAACGPDGQALTYRSQEQAVVLLRAPNRNLLFDPISDLPERRQPVGVPPGDLPFAPTRTPPDDPEKAWPVFLGQIERRQGQTVTYEIRLEGRPYAGLVGEAIRAPSGRAWVQLGAEVAGDRHRFAVFLQPDSPTPGEPPMPRLAIEQDGDIELRGNTTLYGDLTVDGGAIEFGVGPAYGQPRPWRIYHAFVPDDLATPQAVGTEELRIEMAAPVATGAQPQNQVAIGAWSDQEKKFVPCLTVADDCSVTVHGNLVVQGELQGDVKPSPGAGSPGAGPAARVSDEAAAIATGAFISGITGTLPFLYSPQPRAVLEESARPPLVEDPEVLVRDLVQRLKEDPELMAMFATTLVEQALERRLADALHRAAAVADRLVPDAEASPVEAETPAEEEAPAEAAVPGEAGTLAEAVAPGEKEAPSEAAAPAEAPAPDEGEAPGRAEKKPRRSGGKKPATGKTRRLGKVEGGETDKPKEDET